jgi:hypothetical protein
MMRLSNPLMSIPIAWAVSSTLAWIAGSIRSVIRPDFFRFAIARSSDTRMVLTPK